MPAGGSSSTKIATFDMNPRRSGGSDASASSTESSKSNSSGAGGAASLTERA